MDTGERLAAYLAGDLDAAEARRLEGELARDPSLRERLARLRRLDDELHALPPVDVPAAFSARLRDRIQAELDEREVSLGAGAPAADELAARRRRRGWGGLPAWVPAAAGAAAVLAAVVAIGVALPGGDDAADEQMAFDAGDTEAAEEAAGGVTTESLRTADAPVVVDEGVEYDADAVQAMVAADTLVDVTGQGLTDDAASEVAARYAEAFGVSGPEAETTAEGDGAADAAAAPAAAVTTRGDVDPEELEAVRGCLAELLPEDETVIPAYAELGTFEGENAILYGFVSEDPRTGEYTRVQLWVVDRDSCEVLFYAQEGATD